MEHAASFDSIARDFPEIAAIYLFGSLARNTAGPESDADVGIVLRPRDAAGPGWRWRAELASRLEELFSGRAIDLVILDEQGPLFRHEVLLTGRLVHEADRGRRIDFESSSCVEAFDFLPTWRIATEGRVDAIREIVRMQRR
jgi:predicted nucleotidyltransferase